MKPGASGGFVGRADELAALEAWLDRAGEGAPTIGLVEGPAGIGKTTLVRRFLERSRPARLLKASGAEEERLLPYGVLGQLVGTLGVESDPFTTGARLLEVLSGLEDDGPVVLLVDDVQWADAPSLVALTFALRRLQADPVLTLLVARDEPPGLVPESLVRLAGDSRLTLAGLDTSEIARLAMELEGAPLAVTAARRLRDHTAGNPLHVRALLDELGREALHRSQLLLPAPRSFSSLVHRRLASCPPPTRQLVEACSVLGLRCPLGVAAQVGDVDDCHAAIDSAVAAHLLAVADAVAAPDATFPHPLVRAAVYHQLSPGRRARLHTRAASALTGAAALDHRIAAALVADGELAAEVKRLAQAEAGHGALAAAGGHLLASARLTPDPAVRQARLLDALDVLLDAGALVDAKQVSAEIEAAAPSARQRYLLGRLAFVEGRHADAEARLLEAWAPETEPDLAAHVASYLAWVYSLQMRLDDVIEWARRSMAMSETPRIGVPRLSLVLSSLGLAGRSDQALATVDELPGVAADGALTPGQMEQLVGRGLVRMWTDELAGAREDLARVVGERPQPSGVPLVALGWLTEAEFRLGEWDDSVAHGTLAVSLAADSDQVWMSAFVNTMASLALAARGEWPRAVRHVAAARQAAQAIGDPASAGYAAMAAVHLAFCQGDPPAVVAAVAPLMASPGWRQVHEPGVMAWRELFAEALVALGRLDEAAQVLDGVDALAVPRSRRSVLTRVARVRGALAAARGDRDGARTAFEAAVSGVATPFERALGEEAYGRFLRRAGERRAAASRLESALSCLAALGATPFVERVQTELAACGLSPMRRSGREKGRLTPQELAVARLVGTGRTNREVATQLVISVKTVEYHLGNIYAKLDLRTRAQLAAHLAGRTSSLG